jgi:dTDP-4-dehydrorhamnose reductase
MKIAIIGAKRMLGRELVKALGSRHELLAWDIDQIDIADRPGTLEKLAAERPDLIVNSAVFVDLEGCEAYPDKAWAVNAVGGQNLALAAQQAGERLSLQLCRRTYVVRTAWLFGHAPNNYVERVLKAAENEGVVRMPVDQLESPTYTGHLADAILRLIGTGAYGIHNVTGQGACNRASFAQYVLQAAGRSERVEIEEATKLERFAQRPQRSVLDCRLYQLVTGHTLPAWQQGVGDYLANAGKRGDDRNVLVY